MWDLLSADYYVGGNLCGVFLHRKRPCARVLLFGASILVNANVRVEGLSVVDGALPCPPSFFPYPGIA